MTDLLNIANKSGASIGTRSSERLRVMAEGEIKFGSIEDLIAYTSLVCSPAILVLTELEWSDWVFDKGGDGYSRCPVCSGTQYPLGASTPDSYGHSESCDLKKALDNYQNLISRDK